MVTPKACHISNTTAVCCLAAQLSKTLCLCRSIPKTPISPKRSINDVFAQSKGARSKAIPFSIPNPACEISLGKLDFLTSLANKP